MFFKPLCRISHGMMLTDTTILRRVAALGLALGVAALAPAQADAEMLADKVKVTVLPGWTQPDGSHMAALRLTLAPGWKTYWRAPGDAGIPPLLSTAGSRNLSSLTPIWPTPEVFTLNGMRSVGYAQEVVLPLHIVPQAAGQDTDITAHMQIGICSDICVPVSFDFSLPVPAKGAKQPGAPDHLAIDTALADQPVSAKAASVTGVDCALSPIEDGLALSATIDMPTAGGTETVLIEAKDPAIWVAETDATRTGNRLTVTTELVHTSGQAFALDRSGLRFTVLGSNHAVDIKGCSSR